MSDRIIIWGRENSTNVQKPLWLLDELGLDYDRHDAGMQFGVTDTPEYRAMNPNGLVPTLQHGGLTLWESHAILRYLAATFGGETFWPSDPAARAPIDQWEVWSNSTLIPAIVKLFFAIVRTAPSKRDSGLIASALADAVAKVGVLDAHLAGSRYVAGDAFSLADITCGIFMYRWRTMEIERPETPHLDAWIDRLRERPAYRKWGEYSYEALRAVE